MSPLWSATFLVSISTSLIIQGCAIILSPNIKTVPVEEADQHGIPLDRARSLHQGDGARLVVSVLGEPADEQKSCVLDGIIWRYPIRAWNDKGDRPVIVPAVRLRARFDTAGTLIDWGFVDSLTGHPLPVRESLEGAHGWFQSLMHAPPPFPPLIDLSRMLISGQTTQQNIESTLGQWHPDLYCGNGGPVPVVKKTFTESGSEWDWYVDRPSPLFVPPHYLVVSFDKHGSLIGMHFEGTYPGGRK